MGEVLLLEVGDQPNLHANDAAGHDLRFLTTIVFENLDGQSGRGNSVSIERRVGIHGMDQCLHL